MSITDSEARSNCPEGLNSCKECQRYMDDCDGQEPSNQ